MAKLKELEPVVKKILKENPPTRGDDDLLYLDVLDEMQINQISRYQIDNINQVDSAMILDYLAKNPKH